MRADLFQVAILNHLALHPGYWTGEAPAEPKPGAFSAVSLVRDGLEVVQCRGQKGQSTLLAQVGPGTKHWPVPSRKTLDFLERSKQGGHH